MCRQVERRLECQVESVRAARKLVADALDDVGLGELAAMEGVLDDTLLAASELIANAVGHCREWLAMRIDLHSSSIVLSVSDDSPAPAVRRHPGPDETRGRGVDIVARVSQAWGQTTWDGSQKTVWCRIGFPEGGVLAVECSY